MNRSKRHRWILLLGAVTLLLLCYFYSFGGEEKEPRLNLDLKTMGPYAIHYSQKYGLVYFKDPLNSRINFGTYDYKNHLWIWKSEKLEMKYIDLKKLYIDLDEDVVLDREIPKEDDLAIAKEKSLYFNEEDRDFSNFISYLEDKGYSNQIDYYRSAASNPLKRGKLIDNPDNYLDLLKAGYQSSPIRSTGKVAGGMQLYFELHKGRISSGNEELKGYFRDNEVITAHFYDILPTRGVEGKDYFPFETSMEEVAKRLEQVFGKKFIVSYHNIKINYEEFSTVSTYGTAERKSPYDPRDIVEFIQKNEPEATEGMVLFHLALGSYSLGSSATGGAYGSWHIFDDNWLHEIGHALGLRHHFKDREHSDDPDYIFSTNCLMNYGVNWGNIFCPLCKYALNLEIGAKEDAKSTSIKKGH